jgi:hypothetical protein
MTNQSDKFYNMPAVQYSEMIMPVEAYQQTVSLGAFAKDRLRCDVYESIEHGEPIARMQAKFVSELLENKNADDVTLTLSRPVSWWQRFKADVFPMWLLDLFPVRYDVYRKRFRVRVRATYPEFNQVFPDLGEPVIRVAICELDSRLHNWKQSVDLSAPVGHYEADFDLTSVG